jgi:hypothetical protein
LFLTTLLPKRKKKKAKLFNSRVPVAHACNPSYSGGRDQEDHTSKPARANSLQDPILKMRNTKKGLAE